MERITHDDIEKIKVVTNRATLQKLQFFISSFSLALGITSKDILATMGLATGKYTKDLEEKALKYMTLEDSTEKQIYLNSNKITEELITEILEHKQKVSAAFSDLPSALMSLLLEENNNKLFDEFLEVLICSTGEKKEVLENSDITVLLELFTRIFLKPKEQLDKALFLSLGITKLKQTLASSVFIQNVRSLM